MKRCAQFISLVGLLGTFAAPVLFFYDVLPETSMKTLLLISVSLWFVSAPLWMEHKAS